MWVINGTSTAIPDEEQAKAASWLYSTQLRTTRNFYLAVAEASLADGGAKASIVLAIKNHRAWIGTVRWQGGLWTTCGSAQDVELETFFAQHKPARVVADAHLPEEFQSGCEIIPLRTSASALLKRLEKDASRTSLEELRPIYPRVPEAARLWEERGLGS